ncbi:MAG: phage terminase large subunit family protein [Defluviimonas sp.]|uniref:phage terminase large subunit family protein n=1 Tax=Albidovulum sp. TaxID=1872424 RepID=UPI002A2C9071|nr:phage terminase large subunit family protein [Defluviimonas sp.]
MTVDPRLADLRRQTFAALRPPPKLALSDWAERNLRLPAGVSATPGPVRLWEFQRGLADAIGDPTIPRVTCLKAVRCGYSTLLVAAVAAYASNDPCPVLMLVPTTDDARNFMVHHLEPVAEVTPALSGLFADDDIASRNTLTAKRYPGGSLKVIAARAPRALRAHTAKVLLADEVDGMEVTAEGNPLLLAEKRTLSYPDRKIVTGSTPTDSETSMIAAEYEKSDRRVFECLCPECHEHSEILWRDIRWTEGDPDSAAWCCPECGCLIPESRKGEIVAKGHWRATRPEVKGHAGFKLTALVSLMPNASWPNLIREFLAAKGRPDSLKVFVNTVLAETWRDDAGEELDESLLASRREAIGLDRLPPEVLYLTGGADVQKDRIELTSLGWTGDGDALVLGHEIIWGDPAEGDTWAEFDDLLRRDFRHPNGGALRYDAAMVDSGDGGMTDQVYQFARPRVGRRIFPLKGVAGFKRPLVERAKTRGIALQLVGVDVAKQRLLNALLAGTGWRFSDSLSDEWFSQLTAERRVVRYSRGQPAARFERIVGRRAEALDCVVYAMAARALVGVAVDRREAELASKALPKPTPNVVKSAWLER